MGTIRDQRTGSILDTEDDGRRVSFVTHVEHTHRERCPCDCDTGTASLTFDKAELLALLQGGK